MPTWRRGKKLQGFKVKDRRKIAIGALENDLKTGILRGGNGEKLTDKQRERITKEITILKGKI